VRSARPDLRRVINLIGLNSLVMICGIVML
jgi:hypothetical protein